MPAPALAGLLAIALVGEVVLKRVQEKGAELPLLGGDARQEVPPQQAREEPLGQVLGLVGRMPAPADVGVERIPVRGAEVGQGLRACGTSPPRAAAMSCQSVVENRPEPLESGPLPAIPTSRVIAFVLGSCRRLSVPNRVSSPVVRCRNKVKAAHEVMQPTNTEAPLDIDAPRDSPACSSACTHLRRGRLLPPRSSVVSPFAGSHLSVSATSLRCKNKGKSST